MSRRIEIELTSAQADGSWTWRAARAKQPKGVLDGGLVPTGAKPGDVVKAEADFELEGITILSVLAPRVDSRPEVQRIEIIGPSRPDAPGVTTQLAGRGDRRPGRRDRDDRAESRPRHERDDARPRRDREPGRPPRDARRPRPESDQTDRPAPSEAPSPSSDGPRRAAAGSASESDTRRGRPRAPASGGHDNRDRDRSRAPRERPGRPAPAEGDKARRLTPGNAHRKAVLDSLPPERQPIAEQVLRGGIPAVRTALHLEREKAAAEGRPAPNTDQLVAMAEELLPRLKAAEWRDRAEAAAAKADEIPLRDLRSVAAGADVARDDETRALAATIREALERRVAALHAHWSGDVSKLIDENRLIRAVRASARPPEPGARLDPEVNDRLILAAGQALSPDTPPDQWLALLEAVTGSPIRRSVQPVGLPTDAPPELKRAAHQQSGSIPALAKLLGVAIPPPPVPVGAGRRAEPRPRGPRPPHQPHQPHQPAQPAQPAQPSAAAPEPNLN